MQSTVLEAAQAAWAAGLCPIPAAADGSKAPIGQWKQYQTTRPDQLAIHTLFGASDSLGIVCGAVSGRLICLEFEGAFMSQMPEVRRRLEAAGLWGEFSGWVDGYSEISPSNGLHVLVRIDGSDPVPGNTKIAVEPLGGHKYQTLIETRGEGGFVIVAPSGGTTHPTGRPWKLRTGGFDTIALTTTDQWEAVVDCLSSFDRAPAAVEPPPPLPPQLRLVSDSWVDRELSNYPALQSVLQDHGWTYVRTEPLGQLWRRPGKDFGHSARINQSGRLVVFTSSTPLHPGRRTYDALDVALAYELGRPPSPAERVEALREGRETAAAAITGPPSTGEGESPLAIVSDLNLPIEFWASRPYLQHIYFAALHGLVSPDALWQAVKTFYAATVPWNFRLPGNGTVDYIGVMCGGSGSGKTQAKQIALDILPLEAFDIDGVVLGLPPGTGEGITEFFIERSSKDGKQQTLKNRGAGIYVDEGKWLFDVDKRAGSTTIQALKSAWSGELTGSLAGTSERNRFIKPRAVRTSILVGIQPGVAADFLRTDLTDGGLPQRINWSWSHYSNLPDPEHLPEDPGRLDIPIYDRMKWGGGSEPTMLHVIEQDDSVKRAVRSRMIERRRSFEADALEGHADYAKLKSASLHALLDGRMRVTQADWDLAELEWNTSTRIRTHILEKHRAAKANDHQAAGRAAAEREIAADAVYLERAALAAAKLVQRSQDPTASRLIKDTLARFRQRYGIRWQDAVDKALSHGWIVQDGDHSFRPGTVRIEHL